MYIRRNLHTEIQKHLNRKEYTILTGSRQCGKTTLLRELYSGMRREKQTVSFVSFEDREILSAVNKHPEELFNYVPRPGKLSDTYSKIHDPQSKKQAATDGEPETQYVFIDEIQNAADPSGFLKYLYDIYGKNLKIIATGSSAFYIDQKFTDSLSGRKRIFELNTLSFDEWLRFNDAEELISDLEYIREKHDYISSRHREIMQMFSEFLVFGGFPEVALERSKEEKIALLREIRDSFLKRDIDEAGIRDSERFYMLLRLLASQIGNLVNRNELAATIGVDNKTIDKYLHILQNCFHVDLVRPFYSNLRKELTKMPMLYFRDSGLRNSILNRFSEFNSREDAGALLENYVFNRLSRLHEKENVRYWRTTDGKEIDFIVSTSFNEGMAYEVKMNCKSGKRTAQRSFLTSYPGYLFEKLSYHPDSECRWVLKI